MECSPYLLMLSAKTEKALLELAARYGKHLSAHPELDLADVCFTANIGRAHFEHRLSVVADGMSSMVEKLVAVANGQEASGASGVFKGQADDADHEGEPQVHPIQKELYIETSNWKKLLILGERYVRGASIEWLDFYALERGGHHQRRKVVLPTYPWDRKRYWVRSKGTTEVVTTAVTTVVTTGTTTEGTERGWLLSLLKATPPNERDALLMETVRHELAKILDLDQGTVIKEREWLPDLGVDSLTALEFTERLEFCLECGLDETLLFDYPTPRALVDYLRLEIGDFRF